MTEKRQSAVVTRVTPVRQDGRIIVHTYGPYDRNKAGSVARKLKTQAIREGFATRSEISICTLLSDPEDLE